MRKFEYHTTHQEKFLEDEQESLDQLGEDGWELVSADGGRLYFKRELAGEALP